MMVIASALVVLLSTTVYALLVWWADRFEKEPKRLLLAALLWGALPAAFLSLLLESSFDSTLHLNTSLGSEVLKSGLAGPIIEELAKALILLILYRWWRLEFDGLVDGLVYGALVGFGFAMMENFLYFIQAAQKGLLAWTIIVFLRQFLFGLNHAFFTSFTGMGFGLARWSKRSVRRFYPILGFAAAVLAHALHNVTLDLTPITGWAFLFTLLFDVGGLLTILLIWIFAIQRESALIKEELAGEVGRALTQDEYAALSDSRAHLTRVLQRRLGRRSRAIELERLLAELAIKKHQLKQTEDDKDIRLRIAQLYAELVHLRQDFGKD
jgi:Predicted membrane protein